MTNIGRILASAAVAALALTTALGSSSLSSRAELLVGQLEPTFSVGITLTPPSVPGGGLVRADVQVKNSTDDPPAAVGVGVKLDWPEGMFSYFSDGDHPTTGCITFVEGGSAPPLVRNGPPQAGDECVMSAPQVGAAAMATVSFWLLAHEELPQVGQVTALVTRGLEQDNEFGIYYAVELDRIDPVGASATAVIVEEAFHTDVSLDRSLGWLGGPDVLATVTVTYVRAIRESDEPIDQPIVGLRLGWPSFLGAGGGETVTGCDVLEAAVCALTGWKEPGQHRVVTIRFPMPTDGAGTGDITATAEYLLDGVLGDASELPTAWVGSDAESFTLADGVFSLDLMLDHDSGYTGGHELTATTIVAHAPSTENLPRTSRGTIPGVTLALRFGWPDFLTPSSTMGCDSFAVDLCVISGLDAVGSSKVVSMTFAMPPAGAPAPPRSGDLTVSGAALTFEPPINPGEVSGTVDRPIAVFTLPSQGVEPRMVALPTDWIGDDTTAFTLLQPAVRVVPGVAKPGDVITVLVENMPPGEHLEFGWTSTATATATATSIAAQRLPGEFAVAPDASTGRWPVLVLRRSSAGTRLLGVHSVNSLFGDIVSTPLLIVPRSSAAPNFVGRGG